MEIGTRTDNNPLYRKLRTVHKDMKYRCYNTNSKNYKNYGGKGITVAEEWQTLNGFLDTCDQVEGWDKQQFLTTGLSLDKDAKQKNVYSIESCIWLPLKENKSLLSANYRNVHAISPTGESYFITNIDKFCREYGLNHANIVQVLNGKHKHHKFWVFWYEGDSPKKQFELNTAISPEGHIVKFYKASELTEYGLNPKCVTRCLRKEREHHKGWKFVKSE